MKWIQEDTLRFCEKLPGYNGPNIRFRYTVELSEVGDGPVNRHVLLEDFCGRVGFLLGAFAGLKLEDIELKDFDK